MDIKYKNYTDFQIQVIHDYNRFDLLYEIVIEEIKKHCDDNYLENLFLYSSFGEKIFRLTELLNKNIWNLCPIDENFFFDKVKELIIFDERLRFYETSDNKIVILEEILNCIHNEAEFVYPQTFYYYLVEIYGIEFN
jgi:hypothetical protein